MNKNLSVVLSLIISLPICAQKINNNFYGYYKNENNGPYSFFSFDNNGKADISGLEIADFFMKGDSLIIFPDKYMLKFIIKENKLIGASEWVNDGTWAKQDSIMENKRKDSVLSEKDALLLNEYYEKTRAQGTGDFSLLFDENLFKEYHNTIENLCSRGLAHACLELFALKLMDEMGGIKAALDQAKSSPLKENPELITLANKIIAMGEPEGHTVLGEYLYTIGQKEKANIEFEKAMEQGSTKAAMLQLNILIDDAKQEEKQATEKRKRKKKS